MWLSLATNNLWQPRHALLHDTCISDLHSAPLYLYQYIQPVLVVLENMKCITTSTLELTFQSLSFQRGTPQAGCALQSTPLIQHLPQCCIEKETPVENTWPALSCFNKTSTSTIRSSISIQSCRLMTCKHLYTYKAHALRVLSMCPILLLKAPMLNLPNSNFQCHSSSFPTSFWLSEAGRH